MGNSTAFENEKRGLIDRLNGFTLLVSRILFLESSQTIRKGKKTNNE